MDSVFYSVHDILNRFVNINGKLVPSENAALPHDNRAFRYGFGLFETMLVDNGQISLAAYHWERLFSGLSQLHISLPKLWSPAFLNNEVLKTVQKNKQETLARVRLQVWDGNGGLFENTSSAQFIIECFPLDAAITQLNENGLVTGIAAGIRKSQDSLSGLKSCNAMIYAAAARQAREHKWNDALILNTSGHVIESTIANIFWIKDGQIFTPPLTEGCVAGVMRRYLLHFLPSIQLPVISRTLTAEELLEADEVLLTNSIRKLKWVRHLGDKSYDRSYIGFISSQLKDVLP